MNDRKFKDIIDLMFDCLARNINCTVKVVRVGIYYTDLIINYPFENRGVIIAEVVHNIPGDAIRMYHSIDAANAKMPIAEFTSSTGIFIHRISPKDQPINLKLPRWD